jgi:ATP-binding cassette, subfamily B, bacterial
MSSENAEKKPSDWALYRRLLHEARACWGWIILTFATGLIASPLALLNPLPMKIAVDNVISGKPLPDYLRAFIPDGAAGSMGTALVLTLVLVLGIALLSKIQESVYYMVSTYANEKLVRGFRSRLFRHAQRLSVLYHDKKGTTDTLYRIQYDAPAISYVAVQGVTPFVTAIVTVMAMLYVTWRIDPHIAWIAIGITPLLLGGFQLYRERLRESSSRLKEIESGTFSVVHEVLGALRVVKAFGQEDREQDRFLKHTNRSIRARLQFAFLDSCFGMLLGMIVAGGTAAGLYIGVSHVQSGIITLGELIMVMAYLGMLLSPLNRISHQAGSLQAHFASADRAFTLLDTEPDVPEKPSARELVRATGGIEFRDVSFAYVGDRAVLQGISFRIPPRTRVGIAGHTGSGKSTLMSLLMRFYDPTSGQILLDGVDLRDYRIAALREQFGIVLQEPVLFSTTIYENIIYGRPDATREMVEAAARHANAHKFITALPDGYDTQVGDRGMSLSGGERQRISIARAFLKDAPVLVLDEPTSSVDVNTEAEIMDAVRRLMEGRTTFIIAHRLSTLEHCDICLHMKDGRLVEIRDMRKNPSPADLKSALAATA